MNLKTTWRAALAGLVALAVSATGLPLAGADSGADILAPAAPSRKLTISQTTVKVGEKVAISGTGCNDAVVLISIGEWDKAGYWDAARFVDAKATKWSIAWTPTAKNLGTSKVRVRCSVYWGEGFDYDVAKVTVVKALTATPTPKVKGTAQVGRKLTADAGTWKPAKVTLKYQWLRGGTAIKGATKKTYTLTAKDKGKKISVKVTGSKSGFAGQSKTSKATSKVKAGTLTAKPTPKISGTAKVGKKLTAVAGKWKPATVTLGYQWYRNGAKIKKATKSTYKVAAADKGKRLTVKVTGKKAGYASVTKTSKKTAKVA
mgnify:FL=1